MISGTKNKSESMFNSAYSDMQRNNENKNNSKALMLQRLKDKKLSSTNQKNISKAKKPI